MKKNSSIYLDNAAATPVDLGVLKVYTNSIKRTSANPSALHAPGVAAKTSLQKARKDVAQLLHATTDSIVFSRGGTESINMAILGTARKHGVNGNHIITTKVEHDAVLACMRELEKQGFDITYLDVDDEGQISLKQLKKEIRPDTFLISIMSVQNEIGTIYPINDIGKMILQYRKKNKTTYPLFHTDACQATNYIDLHVERMHVDLMTLNGSKIYGLKSSGILYKRRGVELSPILQGGKQEQSLRPGTEDVAAATSFAKALEIAQSQVETENIRLNKLQQLFITQVNKYIKDVVLHGPKDLSDRVANNISMSFIGADSETVLIYLDGAEIYAGSGAACSTDKDEPSHVLKACNKSSQELISAIRFSFGRSTTAQEIKTVVKQLKKTVERVRKINEIT